MTPEEYAWLNAQRADLAAAFVHADIYMGALRMYETETRVLRWWQALAKYRRKRGIAHVERALAIQSAHVALLSQVIDSWVAAQQVLGGRARGPIIPQERTQDPH
jgi:hypothetical protein